MKGRYIGFLLSSLLWVLATEAQGPREVPIPDTDCVYIPLTFIQPEVRARVALDPDGRGLEYHYSIKNGPGAEQNIRVIRIQVHTSVSKGTLAGPADWMGNVKEPRLEYPEGRPYSLWLRSRIVSWAEVSGEGSMEIRPGQALGGFKMVAPGLPSIVTYYAQGVWPGDERFEGLSCASELGAETLQELIESGQLPEYDNPLYNAVRGETVGPVAAPRVETLEDLVGFVGTLRDLKDRAAALGWVRSPGVRHSLNQKLDALEADLRRGHVQAALGVSGAFLQEVEGASCPDFDCPGHRPITAEGYALLRYNMEFLREALRRLAVRR